MCNHYTYKNCSINSEKRLQGLEVLNTQSLWLHKRIQRGIQPTWGAVKESDESVVLGGLKNKRKKGRVA